jgi:hypothetical protein
MICAVYSYYCVYKRDCCSSFYEIEDIENSGMRRSTIIVGVVRKYLNPPPERDCFGKES